MELINREYGDDRFERMGVAAQMNANSFNDAKRMYEITCMLCTTKGCGAIKCGSCRVRGAFLENAEKVFYKKLTDEDRLFIQCEKELR